MKFRDQELVGLTSVRLVVERIAHIPYECTGKRAVHHWVAKLVEHYLKMTMVVREH
jgi:hypothetical protein